MILREPISRRRFLRDGSILLASASLINAQASWGLADDAKPRLRIGMLTDLHYADKPAAGTRHYRETLAKVAHAASQFAKEKPGLMVELGDLIDAADSVKVEKEYLARIYKEVQAMPGEKHFVLGNHCVTTLTKEEFLDSVGQKKSHYSFDSSGWHFVVLDACYRADGEPYGRQNFAWNDAFIPRAQVEWLQADLKTTSRPTIVFVHQRIDVHNDYGIKNAAEVRKVLEEASHVKAVFQGHSHKNDYKDINGIHYCTLAAMVEGSGADNNSYSILDLHDDGMIHLHGFHKQSDYSWDA